MVVWRECQKKERPRRERDKEKEKKKEKEVMDKLAFICLHISSLSLLFSYFTLPHSTRSFSPPTTTSTLGAGVSRSPQRISQALGPLCRLFGYGGGVGGTLRRQLSFPQKHLTISIIIPVVVLGRRRITQFAPSDLGPRCGSRLC